MRFRCSRDSLNEMLGLLTNVVPLRASKPVLQNIMIHGNTDQTITCSATDLEIGVSYTLPVEELIDPCETLVSAHSLYGIIRDDWSETISFDMTEEKVKINTAKGSFELLCAMGEVFPRIKDLGTEGVIEISGEDIIDATDKTLFSTAKGDTRYALNGVYINIEDELCEFVTSDTHRLSLCKKMIQNPSKCKVSSIVITKGMSELAKLARGEDIVRIQITAHELIARTSHATLVARLVDGQFPRYRDVIPSQLGITVKVSKDDTQRSLRLAGRVSNTETHAITFKAKGNAVTLTATGGDSGSGELELDAVIEGEGVESNFNYNYILDMLKVLKSSETVFQFRNGDEPMRIDEDDFTHIIMPIRPMR